MRIINLIKSDIVVLIYYALLLMLFLSWQNTSSLPGSIMRLAYMTAVFAPPLIMREKWWVPSIVILFNSLACFGYTSSYMPAMWYTYVVFILLLYAFINQKSELSATRSGAIKYILVLVAVAFFIELIAIGDVPEYFDNFLILALIPFAINFEDRDQCQLLSFTFIVISLVLSLQYIFMRVTFVEASLMGGIEREGFQDINYSACVISLGVMACMLQIFSGKIKGNLWASILVYATIIVSMMALAQNASRGSFLCIAACFSVLLLSSKVKVVYKVLIIVAVIALLVFLNRSGYFELLTYRMQNDDRTGSRADIWAQKLDTFFSESNPIEYLFGHGYEGARTLIQGKHTSTHNDFLSYLLSYGFVGLGIFIAFFTYPFRKAYRQNKIFVAAGTLGLFVIAFTLEPFAKGMVAYYGFWMYLLSLARQDEIKEL